MINTIKDQKIKAGIAINPDTDLTVILDYLDSLDYILVMSVYPGFGGQSFIEATLDKMRYLSDLSKEHNCLIAVDGGVNLDTINKVYKTGVDITIVGSGLYKAQNINERFNQLMNI